MTHFAADKMMMMMEMRMGMRMFCLQESDAFHR